MSARCKVAWCRGMDSHDPVGNVDWHMGDVGTATSGPLGESSSRITVSGPAAGPVEFELELEAWTVAPDQIDNEMSDMAAVASEARELMRAWRTKHFPDIV